MDVAQLGIQVNTKGTSQAKNELHDLTNAAKMADVAADGLSVSTKNAGAAAAASAGGFQKAATATKAYTVAANQNVVGMAKTHNAANLAAQGFDVFTTAAGGMNAGLIGMQQGLQIAQVAMTSTGGFAKELGAAFLAILSPVTLLAVGLTALAAVGIQQVEWMSLVASGMNAVADVLQTIAPYAAAAAAGLALLYAPAIIGGTVQLIALLGRLSVAALGLAASFAAANPAIAFVAGITAAVAAAGIFRDELTKIFGVDIVGAAKTGVNLVIGSFVAAFEDIKFVWNQFPNIVGAAAVGAANAAISAMEKMINAASGMLNQLIQSVNGALSNLPGGFQIGEIGSVDFGQIENTYAAGLSEGVAARNAAVQAALSQDYLGQIGTAIQTGASIASSKLKELASSLTDVEQKSKAAGGAGKKAGEDTAKGFDTASAATKAAEENLSFVKSTFGGFVNDLRNGLKNGEGFLSSFGKAALNVLDRITDKLLNEVMDALFKVNSASSGLGGGGGFLSSIFGGLFGGGRGTSYFPPAPSVGLYASGTASARAGMAIVGEEGPELVRFKGGEQVVPNHHLRGANDNGNRGGDNINVNFAPVINAPNADKAEIALLRQDLRKMKADLPGTILSAVQDGQKRRKI
ncbi:hypothetical protein [Rhizobium sp. LC145]|uniref:hypothetical protein n=1 Tax=Rhizobium sp. LC145 TaxID=1120688 RepID=UPI00069B0F9F|nr:hypothetical protein [Rhizobium sp. LC145]TKT42783.1 phage tail tape-measure protein [Rhizobiaceae bacterium LC148]